MDVAECARIRALSVVKPKFRRIRLRLVRASAFSLELCRNCAILMSYLATLAVLAIVVALLFDFVNGWNDAANSIATVVGTRVLSPVSAVLMAAVLNLLGAFIGINIAETISKFIYLNLVSREQGLIFIISSMASGILWAGWMTFLGLPISASHSLVGGLVGAAVAAEGVKILVGWQVARTLVAMLVAPVLGFVVAALFYSLLIRSTQNLRPSTMDRVFGRLQIVSACWMAIVHGTNDAQKVMGIITLALVVGGFQS